MITRPTLTKSQIIAKLDEYETMLDEIAMAGDKVSSQGAIVEYNQRYNHYKNKISELNKMLAYYEGRGE